MRIQNIGCVRINRRLNPVNIKLSFNFCLCFPGCWLLYFGQWISRNVQSV